MAALAAAGCAGLGGPPSVRFSEADIARMLDQRFPMERRLVEVFDVTVSRPKLRLLPERNRIAAVVDVAARERLFSGRLAGQLDFDAELRFEPTDNTLRLFQVRVQDLRWGGTDNGPLRSGGERLGAQLAERMLEGLVIHTLRAEQIEQMRKLAIAPAAVNVTSRGVEITFAATART